MKKLVSLSLFITLLSACSQTEEGKTDLRISAPGVKQIIIEELPATSDPIAVDTLNSEDGNFELTFAVDSANFYLISTDDGMRIPFFSKGTEQILVELEPMVQEVNRGYNLKGNKESERLQLINTSFQAFIDQVDSLSMLRQQYQDSANSQEIVRRTQKDFEDIIDAGSAKYLSLIDEDPANIANLFIFQLNIYNNSFVRAQDHSEYFNRVDSALQAAYPNNAHAKTFHAQLEQMREQMAATQAMKARQDAIAVGGPAPEISLPKADGSILSLSDLRGKVVLVDFWAAWCRPCRMTNPQLVRVYEQFKDRGFTILSVSFDGLPNQQSPAQDWQAAIQQDGLVWDNHVSDLQGWNSSAGQTYAIQSIPYTVLVDRDGNIIKKEVNPAELPALLEAIL